ncbi:MAG: DUF5610 domain-containing protein, partial [Telluria sp.]
AEDWHFLVVAHFCTWRTQMSLPNIGNSTAAKPAEGAAAASVKPETKVSASVEAKNLLNISIVQASLEVSISTQNEPLALLYKTAITNLNEALQPEFGENAIQDAAGQDNTPDGTAGRIVTLSTAFFESYKNQHPGEDADTALKNFMDIVRGGMEQGFKEAREILDGLKVLQGDIAGNIDKTYELVMKGYADFEASQKNPQPEVSSE